MPGLEISIITAKFKTKAEEPQISRFFSKLLKQDCAGKPTKSLTGMHQMRGGAETEIVAFHTLWQA